MSGDRNEGGRRPLGAGSSGPSLSARLVALVACAALLPVALVGFASYTILERIEADEINDRLGARAAAAERQVSRFVEARWRATRSIASSRRLSELLGQRTVRDADGGRGAAPAADELARFLTSARTRDPGFEGLALFDIAGTPLSTTEATELWSADGGSERLPSSGEGTITGAGPSAVVYMHRPVVAADGRELGRLVTASRLETLWHILAGGYDETPERLRLVDGRRHTLFDSDFHPGRPVADLPAPVADQLLDVRVGNAAYANEATVEVVAAHRFVPSLDLGLLVELPAADAAATSRRWREIALPGSLATMILFAAICSALAFRLTRPWHALVRGVRKVDLAAPSHRLPASPAGETGALTVAFNQLLDALDKSTRRLERLASVDELTGLYNRRHFEERFEVELNRAHRTGRPLSVLVIDLDHFMAFNDRFGRQQGDSFLRHVSSFLRTWLRATDVVARYGGEEFAALLPDTGRRAALEIAERLRVQFAESHPRGHLARDPVTLSIGVSTWEGGAALQADLIEAADRAVLEAKRKGRNQVRFAA